MRRVLVTGGAGYIGSHAAKALALAGMQPVVLDDLSRGHREAVRWGPLVESNIGDAEAVAAALARHQVTSVLHFAALAYVDESMREPARYFENNVSRTLVLLEAMRRAGVRDIVFSSTCATYGTPERVPIDETAAQRPVNPYGESKLMVERLLDWFGRCHDLRWASLRYFNACGADPDGEIGEAHQPETHLVPLVLEAASGDRAAITINGIDYPTPDGTCVRDYVHVTDLAQAHVLALQHLERGGLSQALNLGTGRGHSIREIIAAAERVTGRRIPVREGARRAGDPPALVADPSRAMRLLAWQPVHSDIETILETAWQWHTGERWRGRAPIGVGAI